MVIIIINDNNGKDLETEMQIRPESYRLTKKSRLVSYYINLVKTSWTYRRSALKKNPELLIFLDLI